jgi:methylmalonyl-CoA mutase cobalamin-binding domain/chain
MSIQPSFEEFERRLKMEQETETRRKAETTFRELEERYRAILEGFENGYGEIDLSANAVFFNDSLCKIYGYLLGKQDKGSLGAVVIGTPKGDVHDIGNHVVATIFKAAEFEVHDLGVDVPPEAFVQKVADKGAKVVAMSALITPALVSMQRVIDLLKERGLRDQTYVIIRGPVTSEFVGQKVGADAQDKDAVEGVRLCKKFLSIR